MNQEMRGRITEALAAPLNARAAVNHVIVELRKGLETFADKYDALSFFCDWALHFRLTQTKAMHILAEADAIVDTHFAERKLPDLQMRRLKPIWDFSKFREELVLFLAENLLPPTMPSDIFVWTGFLSQYIDIVSEAPLQYVGSKKLILKRIDNIRVKKTNKPLLTDVIGAGDQYEFGVRWMLRRGETTLLTADGSFVIPKHPTQTNYTALGVDPVTGRVLPLPRETNRLWKDTPASTETSVRATDWLWEKMKDDPWP